MASQSSSAPAPPVPIVIQLEEPPPPPIVLIQTENEVTIKVPEVEGPDSGLGDADIKYPGLPPPPVTKPSLLGTDLFQKPASLAMPPPSTTKVKKARNLVNPGMSMVQWMKLQETRDRPLSKRRIPLSEVAQHNSEQDCWMVIRNCVYDVTEYIPYHPGGVPELMKGAGIDATKLFNEIHRWVNFESILKTCFKGYLDSDGDLVGSITSLVALGSKLPLPTTTFSENESLLVLQVEAPNRLEDELSEDNWHVSVLNRERLLLKVILKPPELWMAHVKLLESLNDDSIAVNFQNRGRKAVITLHKPNIGTWKRLGSPLQDNNRLVDSREAQLDDFCIGTIVEKEQVTHDVVLLGVKTASSSLLGVPVGFHLKIKMSQGDAPARKYTPVLRRISFEPNSTLEEDQESTKIMYFIIKIYPDGQLTKLLGLLQLKDAINMGNVAGRYDPSFLRECDSLVFFAGGSGITPFVRIVDFLFKRQETYPISKIILIFFNHFERDIIWRDEWEQLALTWEKFHFVPVVSKGGQEWTGLTGRVNASLFKLILEQAACVGESGSEDNIKDKLGRMKAMICGSSGFNDACVTMLKSQPFAKNTLMDEDVFIF